MFSDGYSDSKKRDNLYGKLCGQQSRVASNMSRPRSMLRGVDLKTFLFFLVVAPVTIVGLHIHGQKNYLFPKTPMAITSKTIHQHPALL